MNASDGHGRIAHSAFRAAWWLPGGHLQTLWPFLTAPRAPPHTRGERLTLPDGDFVDLQWLDGRDGPLVCVFHGLEGGIESHYARRLMQRLHGEGYAVVLMHFRGCSGTPNRLPRSYHSGDTGDIRFLLQTLRARFSDRPLLAVGYSLGGNALLKYLGESGEQSLLNAAVAVSVPLRLDLAATRMARGLSRMYQWYLLRRLRRSLARKRALLLQHGFDFSGAERWRSFWAFDERVTAPLHGFGSAADYYARSSSRQFLAGIRRPTLILQARDDPFMSPQVLPHAHELAPSVTLELAASGGHVGFVGGAWPGRARYWLEPRISRHLRDALQRSHAAPVQAPLLE